jgi:hypothetical protein
MSRSGIYLIRGENDLVEMTSQPFENEDLFQKLLAQYPRVLGGDQFDALEQRKWLLITREAAIPSQEEGVDRWAVDHLFVDENGVPTFVEVKRSSDTRIRREVVGQMLDYASHAVFTWTGDRIRGLFETLCGDEDPAKVFARVMGPDRELEAFWDSVKTNLQAGKIRLVFVADEIPSELRRVIEFLNKQMDPAEVLGIEIRQYVGAGLQTLVPRVIGRTEEAQGGKTPERGPRWTPERFFPVLAENTSNEGVEVGRDLLKLATELTQRPAEWGTGKMRGSFTARILVEGVKFSLFSVYTTGGYTINIAWNDAQSAKGLASSYNAKVRAALGFDLLDTSTWWKRSDLMGSLESLVPGQATAFRQIASELAADIRKLPISGSQ